MTIPDFDDPGGSNAGKCDNGSLTDPTPTPPYPSESVGAPARLQEDRSAIYPCLLNRENAHKVVTVFAIWKAQWLARKFGHSCAHAVHRRTSFSSGCLKQLEEYQKSPGGNPHPLRTRDTKPLAGRVALMRLCVAQSRHAVAEIPGSTCHQVFATTI